MSTVIATVERAEELAATLEALNGAQSIRDGGEHLERAAELGYKFRGGFFIRRRKVAQETIDLIRSSETEEELVELLKDLSYDELMY